MGPHAWKAHGRASMKCEASCLYVGFGARWMWYMYAEGEVGIRGCKWWDHETGRVGMRIVR